MLLDHVGAALMPGILWLRIVGRIAFPIYCFLLAEGIHYTKSPRKYAMRLGIGAILSEIPFDLALFGSLTWEYQSVMLTLLLGFAMGLCMKQVRGLHWKAFLIIPFALAAEWMRTDYGGMGVVLIALFVLVRDLPMRTLIYTVEMAIIFYFMNSAVIPFFGIYFPIEMFAIFSIFPIWLYSGKKTSSSRWVQWGFYLFYPVHLTLLLIVQIIL